jgi:RNA polymerase sigma-70 factor (ECF subfamily)
MRCTASPSSSARARDEAEDLVSETVLRAFERWQQYRLGTNIRAWLFTDPLSPVRQPEARASTRARCRSRTRARALRRATRSATRIPRATFYDSFLDDEIVRAIDSLPDEYRTAVVLSDIEDLRYAEISKILGIRRDREVAAVPRTTLLQRKLRGYAEAMGYVKALALAS